MIGWVFQRGLKHRDGIYPHLCLIWVRVKHIYMLDRGVEDVTRDMFLLMTLVTPSLKTPHNQKNK